MCRCFHLSFRAKHVSKRKSLRKRSVSEALHTHYYAGESRVCSYTPIIPRTRPSIVAVGFGPVVRRPDPVLPHGAETAGAEAPRQRRAERAQGKRLRGVAPVVASTAAAPEGGSPQRLLLI